MEESKIVKAKITTTLGTFEFEGSEEFIQKQIERIIKIEEVLPKKEDMVEVSTHNTQPDPNSKSQKNNSKKVTIEQPKMLPNLISGKDKIDSLRLFYSTKKPTNHMETFAVLTYWLKLDLELPDVSIDEIWTIYKVLQIRPPKVLIQTFRDGKSKKAYFDTSNKSGRYLLTSFGETFVEHDLPKLPEAKTGGV